MATKPASNKKKSPAKRTRPAAKATPSPTGGVVNQMRSMAGKMLDMGSATVDAARTLKTAAVVAKAMSKGDPVGVAAGMLKAVRPASEQPGSWAKNGKTLRKLREAAGMTIAEVGAAVDLTDPAVIEALEGGKIAIPFELILRLAGVLGRNDPVGFVMEFTRSSNPELWHTLEALGFGKLLIQSAREREFANIYRGSDDARRLTDFEFAEVLAFTSAAFEMAMTFRSRHEDAETE